MISVYTVKRLRVHRYTWGGLEGDCCCDVHPNPDASLPSSGPKYHPE